MKRTIIFSILIFSFASLTWAQGTKQNATRAKEQTAPGTKMVVGKVAEISEAKLIIENPYGAKREIKLDTATKFQIGKRKKLKASDITTGMMVNVLFREMDNTAVTVAEKDSMAAKK